MLWSDLSALTTVITYTPVIPIKAITHPLIALFSIFFFKKIYENIAVVIITPPLDIWHTLPYSMKYTTAMMLLDPLLQEIITILWELFVFEIHMFLMNFIYFWKLNIKFHITFHLQTYIKFEWKGERILCFGLIWIFEYFEILELWFSYLHT